MRRFIPLVLVGLLTLGAVAGAAVAIASTPRQAYTPSGALASNSGAASAPLSVLRPLRSALAATLHARSFMVQQSLVPQSKDIAYYNAPDRVRQGELGPDPPIVEIIIGHTVYLQTPLSILPSTASWEVLTTHGGISILGGDLALLRVLGRDTDVTRNGSTYQVRWPKYPTVRVTVQTVAGHVTQVAETGLGGIHRPRLRVSLGPGTHKQVKFPAVKSLTITFSLINAAPVVSAPPSGETSKGTTCSTTVNAGVTTCTGGAVSIPWLGIFGPG
ncbi:MAG TPA: hypothetical protein VGG38_18460 [Acidimicrobiales bacterium]|jgi:hypothetical protein